MKVLNTNEEIEGFLGRNPLQSISIRVTQRCNLKCRHCYASAGTAIKNELTTAEIKMILDESRRLGAIRVFFGGGEPFIRNDILEIFKYAKQLGFSIYTSTNGTVMTEEIMQEVSGIGLKVFQVSIDGIGKTDDEVRGVKGAFEKSIESLEMAKKYLIKTKVTMAFVLTKTNRHEVKKMFDLAVVKKADVFALIPLFAAGRMKDSDDVGVKEKSKIFDDISRYYLKLKKEKNIGTVLSILASPGVVSKKLASGEFGCGFVCTFPNILGFNANGDVSPCDGLIGTKGMNLGNIRKEGLKKIWGHPLMKELREVAEKDLNGVCKICNYKSLCQGGCRAGTIKSCGNLTDADPLCQSFFNQGVFPKENLK